MSRVGVSVTGYASSYMNHAVAETSLAAAAVMDSLAPKACISFHNLDVVMHKVKMQGDPFRGYHILMYPPIIYLIYLKITARPLAVISLARGLAFPAHL